MRAWLFVSMIVLEVDVARDCDTGTTKVAATGALIFHTWREIIIATMCDARIHWYRGRDER
jgi:hypothetical protein